MLEFDHVGAKRSNVSSLVGRAWSTKRLAEEIEVCQVVCVNCHRLRTYRRRSSWRTNPSTLDTTPDLLANERRNMIHVRSVLATGQCVDCGIRDLRLLEFDHVGPKRGNVIEIARRGCSFALLEDEISQCELRCANCHRRRTKARAAMPDPSVSS